MPHVTLLHFKQVIEEQMRRRIIHQTADTLTVAPRRARSLSRSRLGFIRAQSPKRAPG